MNTSESGLHEHDRIFGTDTSHAWASVPTCAASPQSCRLHRDRTSKNSVHELLISWMRARHFRYGALHDSGKKDGHLADNLKVTRAALRPYGVNEWIPLTAGS